MWPHKKGLGIRLSYGVPGNANIGIKESSNDNDHSDRDEESNVQLKPLYEFAKQQDHTKELSPIEDSLFELVPSLTSNFTNNSNIYHRLKQPRIPSGEKKNVDKNGYIPLDLVRSFLIESNTLTSNIAYDPNYGNLFVLFDLLVRKKTKPTVKAMVFVSGESLTVLNICVYCRKEVASLNTSERILLSKRRQISFSEPIRQIEAVTPITETATLMLIRTSSRVYILGCSKSSERIDLESPLDVQLHIIGEVNSHDLESYQFADSRFNTYSARQFAIIDIKGNFGIWDITKTLSGIKRKSIKGYEKVLGVPDVSEISNWKRISWIHDSDHLLVLTRSKVTEYTIAPEINKHVIVTSNSWSRIRDFTLLETSAFLLTSKELIWFDIKQGFTRRLSWKHFLNDKDPSLKFSISNLEDGTIICLIFSQISPMILIYTFGIKNGSPCSLLDPYFITKGSPHSDLRQVVLMPLDKNRSRGCYNLIELSTSMAVHMRCLSIGSSSLYKIDLHEMDVENQVVENIVVHSKDLSKKHIQRIVKQITKDTVLKEEQTADDILNYANRLQASLESLNEDIKDKNAHFSVYEFCNDVPLSLHDLLELDDMIAQFEESLPEDDIKMVSLINNSFIKKSAFATGSSASKTYINDIAELIEDTYYREQRLGKINSIHSKTAMSTLLGLSLIKFQLQESPINLEQGYQESLEKAPKFVQSMLREWDSPDEKVVESASQYTIHDTVPSIPTIGASQRQTQTRLLSQPKPARFNSSQLQFAGSSLASQSQYSVYSQSQTPTQPRSQLHSQSRPSSSQPKKKRKKKGGFS